MRACGCRGCRGCRLRGSGGGGAKWFSSSNHLPLGRTNMPTRRWTCPGALITSSCQTGRWGRYIIQGPPLTSPRLSDPSDKTSDKLEGLRVHASCLNVQGGGKKKCLFYTVWREKQTLAVLLVILLPACVCIRRCLCSGRPFRGDAFVRRCCQTHFWNFPTMKTHLSSCFTLQPSHHLPLHPCFLSKTNCVPFRHPSTWKMKTIKQKRGRERGMEGGTKKTPTFTGNRGNRSLVWNGSCTVFLPNFRSISLSTTLSTCLLW